MKACTKCAVEKDASGFYGMKSAKDGLQSWCKVCMEQAKKERMARDPAARKARSARITRWQKKNHAKLAAKRAASLKRWKERNAVHVATYGRKYRPAYVKERCARDPAFKLRLYLASSTWRGLKGQSRSKSTQEALGCTFEELRAHIERQFTRAMTWANWGEVWHVDHIRPLAKFDLTDAEQLRAACHFTNLRPLDKAANLSKGAKEVYLI